MRMWSIMVAALVLALVAAAGAAPVQKVTLTMRDFSYSPNRITLQAGTSVELTFVNKGKVAHEFMAYDRPKGMMMGHEWVEKTNYFHGLKVEVRGGKVTRHGGDFMELMVRPGQSATLRFTPTKKGTFEFGCMYEGHYEAGQKGVLVVK